MELTPPALSPKSLGLNSSCLNSSESVDLTFAAEADNGCMSISAPPPISQPIQRVLQQLGAPREEIERVGSTGATFTNNLCKYAHASMLGIKTEECAFSDVIESALLLSISK